MQFSTEIPTGCASNTHSFHTMMWCKKVYGKRFEKMYGVRLRIWLPLLYSLVRVLSREEFRQFNARWNQDTKVIEYYKHVNMGISFGTEEGLFILTIPMAEKHHIGSFAKEVDAILQRAGEKNLTRADLENYTFIFNNVGGLGHERGNSLLPRRIAAMLNLGSFRPETDRAILDLFFDHRVFDGYPIKGFVDAVYDDMEEHVIPELIWRVMLGSA